MEKQTVEIALLLDFYGPLLTEKQREYLDLYYNEDFSLAEIAQLGGISPQAVRDVIRRGENILRDTEAKTDLLARFSQMSDTAQKIKARLEAIESQINNAALSPGFQEIYRDLDSL